VRLDAVADTNFSLWHTAVFSNDGKKVVFTDEWGGGTSPNCQAMHPLEMGGNTTLVIGADRKFRSTRTSRSPRRRRRRRTAFRTTALIPVPGRDLMVQGWYQGGVNLIDFTDPTSRTRSASSTAVRWTHRPGEPTPQPARGTIAGSWGAYWYNGYIYSSEMARGLDILELLPSQHLSANEIAAAKLVMMEEFNPQSQPRITWPAAFPVVRSYLDQLGAQALLPVRNPDVLDLRGLAEMKSRPSPSAACSSPGPLHRAGVAPGALHIDAEASSTAFTPSRVPQYQMPSTSSCSASVFASDPWRP
jgi:hypothetical protein